MNDDERMGNDRALPKGAEPTEESVDNPWSAEYYGAAPEETSQVAAVIGQEGAGEQAQPRALGRWWSRGRVLVAGGAAATVLAVGGVGFAVGSSAADSRGGNAENGNAVHVLKAHHVRSH